MVSAPKGRYKSTARILVDVLITAVVAFILYSFIGALVIGVFLYYATRPIYRWVKRRTDRTSARRSRS